MRGGIGLFQNTPGVGSDQRRARQHRPRRAGFSSSRASGRRHRSPNWSAYRASASSIPGRCADGTTGTVFADATPNVSLFSKDYIAPRSLRSNLQWAGPVLNNRFSLSVDGTYSLNLNQTGFVDLNFNPQERFTLDDEGGRPVFVQPTSIVPGTGTIASRDARVSSLFSRVTEQRSDLRSESRQIYRRVLAGAVQHAPNVERVVRLLQHAREVPRLPQHRRAIRSTSQWGRASFDSRHQIVYSLGYNFWDAVRVSWFGQFRSGQPFTPVISGDVNGDGYSNDRAFIFDPKTSSGDPLVAPRCRS